MINKIKANKRLQSTKVERIIEKDKTTSTSERPVNPVEGMESLYKDPNFPKRRRAWSLPSTYALTSTFIW